MKAAIYHQTGPAADVLKIIEWNKPAPAAGQVLVKMHASGVNPTDTKTRAGIFPIQGEWTHVMPHHDGAGVIEAVGSGVSELRVGERVWLHSVQWGGADGTAAEYVVAPAENAIVLPDDISFEAGATFGVPLLTAYHAVTMDGPVAGKTLLVQGGAGAVGNYAIQIAKQKGATVIATVSSPDKAEAALEAGADHVINYKERDVIERVREVTDDTGVDHIIEVNLGANATLLPGLIKNGGFVAVYGSDAFTGEFPMVASVIQQLRIGFFIVFMLPRERLDMATADLSRMLDAGQIKAPIHAHFPLEQIAQAHDAVDDKSTIGNVVVRL
ncbi:NADPH:quinone reductase [Roseobacter sp.]|uniref:NADPH:quinone reductase n=1 Tax=Roseobacter sp. TaxID=1907202 RepID=UPI0029666171|nr:NADPH:quinone reductase [Roseobacter sp.]MDW3182742.1 NADPH:quinone reductase [Roseobacter sp.]